MLSIYSHVIFTNSQGNTHVAIPSSHKIKTRFTDIRKLPQQFLISHARSLEVTNIL